VLSGDTAVVQWVGHRHVDLRRHPRPEAARPVLIEAGALADGVPSRDLLVSPDHAMWLSGRLIPAKVLCNGHSVRQIACDDVTYFHIELPQHGIVLANNTPAESYLETGQRAGFANGGEVAVLHPHFAEALRSAASCGRLEEAGPVVEAVRQRILDRAALVLTDDPVLRQERSVDGIRLCSRTGIPGELGADPRDRRRLGVKISAIEIDGVMIASSHPLLVEGWHDVEPDGRWTDGNALVPAALLGAAATLIVHVVACTRYAVNGAKEIAIAV